MSVIVKAKKYIQNIRDEQKQQPLGQKKVVPSVEEIAQVAQVKTQTIYSFLNRQKHRRIDTEIVDGIIKSFRAYGHNTQLSDLVEYVDD